MPNYYTADQSDKITSTEAEWESSNRILANGDIGFETDTLSSKTGDGATRWNDLPYSDGPKMVQAVLSSEAANPISTTAMPVRGLSALKRSLESGRTTGIAVLSDSTANDTTDWAYRFAQVIGTRYPNYTVTQRLWSDALQSYAAPTVIQEGPSGVQHLNGVADSAKNTLLTKGKHPTSGNVDIRVKLQADNWGTAPTLTSIASRSGVSGTYSYYVNYTASKAVQFVYSVNGTALLTALSTALIPFTGSQIGWIRVVAIANNGTQAEFRFYTSTDGVTWTQLGATVNATSYTLFDGGASFEFGGRGTLGFAGKIYETEYRDGEDGPTMAPSLPSLYGPNPLSTVDATVQGAPVVTLLNGSHAGASLTYLGNTTRLPKLLPDYGQAVLFTSSSHNDGGAFGASWIESYRAWLAAIDVRRYTPTVVLTQNPERPAATYHVQHAYRRLDLLGLADERSVIDTYKAFVDYGDWNTGLLADSIHPNAAGSDLWRDTLLSYFTAS